MALLWLDGFDSYGTTDGNYPTGITNRYSLSSALTGNLDVADGRVSGKAIRSVINSVTITTPSLGNIATIVVGFAFRYTQNQGAGTLTILSLLEGANLGVNLRLRHDGDWEVYLGSTLIGATVGKCIGANAWAFLELKVATSNTGSVEFRINGETVINEPSVDTQPGANSYVNTVRIHGHNVAADQHDFDDLYILDTSGSVNNNFLGSRKVETIFPTAEGSQIDWTPLSGTDNALMVDDNPHDSATTYNTSATSGHRDLYAFADMAGTGDIDGIQVVIVSAQSDATPFSIKDVVKSGATVDVGAGQAIGGTTYVAKQRVLEENPDTTNPWTASEINSAEFGIEVA
jgi:hypothetical protein